MLPLAQRTTQDFIDRLRHFQQTIGLPEQGLEQTRQSWLDLTTLAIDRLIPTLNQLLEVIESENLDPVFEAQLRSLGPEVGRLIKLLQIDWQFWQAAKQPDRRHQRQQQLLHHAQQLEQLLAKLLSEMALHLERKREV